MSDRVEEILSYYNSEPPGVLRNLCWILESGRTAGSGKAVILPVDQGWEHGPGRSFEPNPPGYDPEYHFKLALRAGCSAYAAPLGFLRIGARKYAGRVPLILKLNNNECLRPSTDPCPAITASPHDALELGCAAIGFTIYPGSTEGNEMYEGVRKLIEEARSLGLPTVIWSYPRGASLSKEGETAIDVVAYAAHIACQLGAHVVKVKPPTSHIEVEAAKKVYKDTPLDKLEDRVKAVIKAAFNGRRIVMFSGGPKKDKDEQVLEEIRSLAAGGAFGSIMGRNAFQRPADEAVKLLNAVQDIYLGK